jgi:WD40 repeat protein
MPDGSARETRLSGDNLTVPGLVDGRQFASGGDDGRVRLWTSDDGSARETANLSGHLRFAWSVAFSPDGVAHQRRRWRPRARGRCKPRPAKS